MNMSKQKEEIEEKVRDWFESSGKMKEIQAKLRAELYDTIQGELKYSQDLPLTTTNKSKGTPQLTRLINWLISEHLAQNRNWLTNSVFVSEAEIEERISAPGLIISSKLGSQYKQYETEIVSGETISNILQMLGFESNHRLLKAVVKSHQQKSQSILCSLISNLAVESENTGQTDNLKRKETSNKTVPGQLNDIDSKYEKMLKDFKTKRNEDMKYNQKVCRNCEHYEEEKKKETERKSLQRNQARRSLNYDEEHTDSETSMKSRANRGLNWKSNNKKEKDEQEKDNEKCDALYSKIDEFLKTHENEKEVITKLNLSLQKAEHEIIELKNELQLKEERIEKEKQQEKMLELGKIIKDQKARIEEQTMEMNKLRSEVEISRLRETTARKADNRNIQYVENLVENKNNEVKNSSSPTLDYLTNMKVRLDGLNEENETIEEEFEDLQTGGEFHGGIEDLQQQSSN